MGVGVGECEDFSFSVPEYGALLCLKRLGCRVSVFFRKYGPLPSLKGSGSTYPWVVECIST